MEHIIYLFYVPFSEFLVNLIYLLKFKYLWQITYAIICNIIFF